MPKFEKPLYCKKCAKKICFRRTLAVVLFAFAHPEVWQRKYPHFFDKAFRLDKCGYKEKK